MRLIISILIVFIGAVFMNTTTVSAHSHHNSKEVITIISKKDFKSTLDSLLIDLKSKNIKIFSVYDQKKEAEDVGQKLSPTTLVIFGNPAVGTALMVSNQKFALELPLKILITEYNGKVEVSYVNFSKQAKEYHVNIPTVEKIEHLLNNLAIHAAK